MEWQENSGERNNANREGHSENGQEGGRRRQRINRYESVRPSGSGYSRPSGSSYSRPAGGGYQRPSYGGDEAPQRSYGSYGNYGGRDNNYGSREGGYGRSSYGSRDNYGSRDFTPRRHNYRDEQVPAQQEGQDTNYNRSERSYGAPRNQRDNFNRVTGFRPRQGGQGGGFKKKPKFNPTKQITYDEKYVDPSVPVRLNKYLANAGICSRREADEFIQAGIVSVNGEIVTELGTKVLGTDIVKFHDQPIRSERKVYILLNKPKDCVTTAEDTHARKTVLDVVKNACSERIYPVGRLDRNTTGVLLLTNDGELASKLTHPKFKKKKIYHATLDRPLEPTDYDRIMQGIELDGGEVVIPDALEMIKEGDNTQVGIEIHSGQNRVVRRIFEAVGYKVTRLDRVFFAGLTKKNVARGKWRFLTQKEVNMLQMGAYE